MKKLLICSLLAGCALHTTTAQAQDIRFGIKGGLNMANITVSNDGDIDDNKMLPSFHVGGYFDLPVAPVLSLQAGLMLSGKGTKYNFGDLEIKMNPIYLELPVNVVGKIPLGDNMNLIAGVGPYIAMGVAGKYSAKGDVLGIPVDESDNINYSDDDPANGNNGSGGNLKRWDFGLNALAGLELKNFTINANYGFGMTNINPGSDNNDNDKFKNRVLSVSVGFLF